MIVKVSLKNKVQELYQECESWNYGIARDFLLPYELYYYHIAPHERLLVLRMKPDYTENYTNPLFVSGDDVFYLDKDIECFSVVYL